MLTFDNKCFCGFNPDICADAACKIIFPKYEKSDPNHKRNIDCSDWLLRDMTYSDITYTPDFEKFKAVDTDSQNSFKDCKMIGKNKDFSFPLSPGLIKGIEWDSEQETRIRIALSYKGLSNSPITGSPSTPFNYIYIPIADALKTMSVTMNPWHCDCFAKELKDLLGNNLLTEKCEIKESSMRDQVKR